MRDPASITYRTSRAKALPMAIAMFFVLFMFGLILLGALGAALSGKAPGSGWALLPFTLIFGLLAWLQYKVARRVIAPDTLVLTTQGFRITRFGRPSEFEWGIFGDPYACAVPNGKSTREVIALPYLMDHDQFLIPAEDYIVPGAVLLRAVEQAKSGHLPAPVAEKTPWVFAYVITPAIAAGTALFIGSIGYALLNIRH